MHIVRVAARARSGSRVVYWHKRTGRALTVATNHMRRARRHTDFWQIIHVYTPIDGVGNVINRLRLYSPPLHFYITTLGNLFTLTLTHTPKPGGGTGGHVPPIICLGGHDR